jgi:hypothetical protein
LALKDSDRVGEIPGYILYTDDKVFYHQASVIEDDLVALLPLSSRNNDFSRLSVDVGEGKVSQSIAIVDLKLSIPC